MIAENNNIASRLKYNCRQLILYVIQSDKFKTQKSPRNTELLRGLSIFHFLYTCLINLKEVASLRGFEPLLPP